MKQLKNRILLFALLLTTTVWSQNSIPVNRVLETKDLKSYLNNEVKNSVNLKGAQSEEILAAYFKQKFAERYFYDWHSFAERFDNYNKIYNSKSDHISAADDYIKKFNAATPWVLPFNYLNGEKVNAYALRHVARQHKMVDIAFSYFYSNKQASYMQYFLTQRNSLNTALLNSKYEKIEDGNGTYESFRSGYRVLNWLNIHNMFLSEDSYSANDQLITIATLLQHGASLYAINAEYQPGNHQTRGVSALAMIAILLRDFKGTDLWYNRAMQRLTEHLDKEINNDGFQFERSVHYHISDIENYFYVYQLIKISELKVDPVLESKLKSLFETLVKISYPDKSTPVLQDDTDNTWAEKNDISGAMTLGYLLFQNPEFGYFSESKVDRFLYWFLQNKQVDALNHIEKKQPTYGSVSFDDTKYYIMRDGWNPKDKMMIVSAGLDPYKPDHQHGDMLGVQAMANGQTVLPNYQVNYALADYQYFKNSMVKNVALVDDELQGKQWTGNQGGSGFGKFKELPVPKTICWKSTPSYDLFVGSHNGFQNKGVEYSRQVINLKNDFWIVKDNFKSDSRHTYKQVWQGHYTSEHQPNLLRSTFADASGCDILQLNATDTVSKFGMRGKDCSVVSKLNQTNFNFITVIFPYSSYSKRINELLPNSNLNSWKVNNLSFDVKGDNLVSLSKDKEAYLFNVNDISLNNVSITFSAKTDLYISILNNRLTIHSIGDKSVVVSVSTNKLDETKKADKVILAPGKILNFAI